MNCEEMRMKIWSGQMDADVEEHIKTCEACRKELRELQAVMLGLQAVSDVPKPSRSLKPSAALIRSTVRKNRLRRYWRSSAVAASVTVLLGTGVGLGLQNWQHGGDAELHSIAGSAPDAANERKQESTGQAATYDSSAMSGLALSKEPPTANRKAALPVVEVSPKLGMSDVLQAFAQDLPSSIPPEEQVQTVEIIGFEDLGQEEQVHKGTLTLRVSLQPGVSATRTFTQGEQTLQIRWQYVDGKPVVVSYGPL